MEEYRVKVTVRNNLLLSAIENAGFRSQSDFARSIDIEVTALSALVSLRKPPINPTGSFSEAATKVMEGLGACPSDLWTDAQLTMQVKKNTSSANFTQEGLDFLLETHSEVMSLPDPYDEVFTQDMARLTNNALSSLNEREGKIIKMLFGVDCEEKSLLETAEAFGITHTRIAQIRDVAMRKLRHPSRSDALSHLLPSGMKFG